MDLNDLIVLLTNIEKESEQDQLKVSVMENGVARKFKVIPLKDSDCYITEVIIYPKK